MVVSRYLQMSDENRQKFRVYFNTLYELVWKKNTNSYSNMSKHKYHVIDHEFVKIHMILN